MTNVTRQELEAAARLLGYRVYPSATEFLVTTNPQRGWHDFDPENSATDLLALARAAKLRIDYSRGIVLWKTLSAGIGDIFCWPEDGTEAECFIKAASAVQLEREKQQ